MYKTKRGNHDFLFQDNYSRSKQDRDTCEFFFFYSFLSTQLEIVLFQYFIFNIVSFFSSSSSWSMRIRRGRTIYTKKREERGRGKKKTFLEMSSPFMIIYSLSTPNRPRQGQAFRNLRIDGEKKTVARDVPMYISSISLSWVIYKGETLLSVRYNFFPLLGLRRSVSSGRTTFRELTSSLWYRVQGRG